MRKKFLAALCAMSMVLVNFSMILTLNVSAEAALWEAGDVLSNNDGNIFAATDKLTFGQTITNNAGERMEINCTTKILDEDGIELEDLTQTWGPVYVEIGQEKTFSFTLKNPGKYGLYKLRLTEQIKVGETVDSQTYEKRFSICISDGNNLNPQFGYNQGIVRTGVADNRIASTLMVNSGAKWHREGIEMAEDGAYPTISDESITRLQDVKSRGLESVCIIKGNSAAPPSTPAEIEAYADYCTYIATRLGGLVNYFEIWNEWNASTFNKTNEPPETYADVLKAAYTAIKRVNPDYKVLGCATAGFATAWIDSVLTANGGTPYMDILSLHDYEFTTTDGFTEQQFIDNFDSLKTILAGYGLDDLPLWLTEAGFSTYDNASGFVPGCSEEEQLNSLVMLNAVNKSYGLFDNIIQYCLYDKNDPSDIESNFGVVKCWEEEGTTETDFVTSAAKPAYIGIAAMNHFIGGNAEFISKTVDEVAREYAFGFYNNNLKKNVTLLINGGLDNSAQRSVNLDCKEIELYDKYGNFIERKTSETGEYLINVSTEPLYAVSTSGAKIRVDSNINFNTGVATVSGTTGTPNDLVTLMLVTDGEPITTYDASRIEYLAQVTADENGDFSFEFAPENPEGDYQVYVNSKSRRNKNIQDIVFTYSAAGMKLLKNGGEITELSQLSAGDSVNVKVGGLVVTGADDPKIIVTQYKDNKIVDVSAVSATGDASTPGNEIVKSFTVAEGVDKIKIMYWKMNRFESVIGSFEVQ